MIKRTRDNARRTRLAAAIGVLVLIAAVAATGLALGFDALRGIWREQCRITDPELDVVITNNKDQDEQRRMVQPEIITYHFGLTNGANLATIPFAALREKLLGRIPNVRDLKIERRMPKRVMIEVVERDPAVRVAPPKGKSDTGLVADAEGVVFPFYGNVSALPVVPGAPTPGPQPGKRLSGMSAAALRLVEAVASLELTGLSVLEGDRQFDSRAVVSLQNFIDAARAEGLSVYLSSAYRPYSEQQYLFDRKTAQLGGDTAAAAKIVLPAGTSEHQLGLCADITDQYYETKTAELENAALYQWMLQHCAEYGFILRYPADKEDITGVMYEPWHFRYVGEEAAEYIMEHGICLEEFVALYD